MRSQHSTGLYWPLLQDSGSYNFWKIKFKHFKSQFYNISFTFHCFKKQVDFYTTLTRASCLYPRWKYLHAFLNTWSQTFLTFKVTTIKYKQIQIFPGLQTKFSNLKAPGMWLQLSLLSIFHYLSLLGITALRKSYKQQTHSWFNFSAPIIALHLSVILF